MSNGTRSSILPGIREFGLLGVTPRDLRQFFPEFEAYAKMQLQRLHAYSRAGLCSSRCQFASLSDVLRIYESLGDPE